MKKKTMLQIKDGEKTIGKVLIKSETGAKKVFGKLEIQPKKRAGFLKLDASGDIGAINSVVLGF